MKRASLRGEYIQPSLWTRVGRHQLRLAGEAEFSRRLQGAAMRYDLPASSEPPPSYLDRFLRATPHDTDEQIAACQVDIDLSGGGELLEKSGEASGDTLVAFALVDAS